MRRRSQSISAKDVAQLEKVHKQAVDAAKRGNVRDFLAKSIQFHFIIYRAAKSPALLPVIESFWLQFGPFLNFAFADEALTFGLQHHAEAVEAFKRGVTRRRVWPSRTTSWRRGILS